MHEAPGTPAGPSGPDLADNFVVRATEENGNGVVCPTTVAISARCGRSGRACNHSRLRERKHLRPRGDRRAPAGKQDENLGLRCETPFLRR